MNLENIRALAFDVGGTILNWRTGIIRDLAAWGKGKGMTHDWEAFTDRWRTNSLDMALNAKQAVPALIQLLDDEDNNVRRLSAWVLGKIGPEAKQAVPALILALNDENKYVRRNSAWALGGIRSEAKQAVPALTSASNFNNGFRCVSDVEE